MQVYRPYEAHCGRWGLHRSLLRMLTQATIGHLGSCMVLMEQGFMGLVPLWLS